jgi:hypothetical protein
MRNQEEIERQINGILAEKERLPEVSMFDTPNHEIADIKIAILRGSIELEDVDDGDWSVMDSANQVYRGAEEATEWLDGEREEDLFEEA